MKQSGIPTAYQPEIDGLRAVAVLAVVGFHAGFPGFPGGFVGVDVFFVISGYLITQLLARELNDTGTIGIVDFYARRARRLLPALAVVLLTTLVLSLVLLTAVGEQQGLADQALATAAFASNFYFWRTHTGYFAEPAEHLPLLHTWTLAVEEQFYIVWPLVVLATAAMTRLFRLPLSHVLIASLAVSSAVSFVLCGIVTVWRQSAAFYLTPFRAWEFGVGGLLAVALPGLRYHFKPFADQLIAFGSATIVLAVVVFDSNTLFPGTAALVPVAGAASVIAGFAANRRSSRTIALYRSSPLVILGKLSYSWYLWHWPLLAIMRSHALGEDDLVRDAAVVATALVLSALTFVWVEQPIRERRPWPFATNSGAITSGLALLGFVAAAAGAVRTAAYSKVGNDPVLAAAHSALNERFAYPVSCAHFRFPFVALAPVQDCTVGARSRAPDALLWGDSHAYHFVPAMAQQSAWTTLPRAMGDCRPYLTQTPPGLTATQALAAESCARFNRAVLVSLPQLKSNGLKAVIIAARWSRPAAYESAATHWHEGLHRLLDTLRSSGLSAILIADVPGYAYSVPHCLARRPSQDCTRSRAEVDAERATTMRRLREIAATHDEVVVFDPISRLCDSTTCYTMRNDVVLYSDQQHLAPRAAVQFSEALGEMFSRATASRPEIQKDAATK